MHSVNSRREASHNPWTGALASSYTPVSRAVESLKKWGHVCIRALEISGLGCARPALEAEKLQGKQYYMEFA